VTAHDDIISAEMGNLLSSSCVRKFRELELYFCYGCHFDEADVTANKTIYLCADYAKRLWGNDTKNRSTKFDQCGMKTYWRNSSKVVIPSQEWKNALEFFAEVKPPLFS
jgi:hypothetical protein